MHPIKFGDKAKPISIERYRAQEGVPSVITFLSDDIFAASYHYHPKLGYFHCFQGACCQELSLPPLRYIIPVVEYNTASHEEYGGPIFVKYVAMGQTPYDLLLVKAEVGGDLKKSDWLVICADTKFQDLSFERLPQLKWLADEALKLEVVAQYKSYKALIELSVARKIDEARFMKDAEITTVRSTTSTSSSVPSGQQAISKGKPSPAKQAPTIVEQLNSETDPSEINFMDLLGED